MVRTLLDAYYRLSHLIRELMKFGIVGSVAFVVDVGLFNLGLALTDNDKPLTSKAVSTVVATTVAYAGNRHWTFRKRSRSGVRREYGLFVVFNGVGLAIALACLAISHYLFDFTSTLSDNIAANVVGLGLGTTFRFWSYRRYVFPGAATTQRGTSGGGARPESTALLPAAADTTEPPSEDPLRQH